MLIGIVVFYSFASASIGSHGGAAPEQAVLGIFAGIAIGLLGVLLLLMGFAWFLVTLK